MIRNNEYENNLSFSESDFYSRIEIEQIKKNTDKINELRCNTCLMIPLIIDIFKKQIIYKCNCNTSNINLSLSNFITNFNNDKTKIKCFRCENLSKNYCFDCNFVFCESHKSEHFGHKIIEIDKIDCYCQEHPNEKKICYCKICNKDMCSICKKTFHLHLKSSKNKEDIFTYITDSYPFKDDIKKFNSTIEELENKLKQIENKHLKYFSNVIEIKKLFEDNKIINLNLLKILKLLSRNLTLADFPNYSNFHNYKFLFEKINVKFANNLINNNNINQNDYKNFFNNDYILKVEDNNIVKKSLTFINNSIKDSSFLHVSIPNIEDPSVLNIKDISINDTNEVERIKLTNKNYDYSIYDYCIEKELRNSKLNLITFCIVLSNKKIALLCGTHVEILDNNFKKLDKSSSFDSVLLCIEELINEKKLIVGANNGNIIILENINDIDNSIKKIKECQNPILKLCRFSNDNKFASLTIDEIKIYDSYNYNCILTIKSEANEKIHSIIEHSSYLIATYNNFPIKFFYFNNNRFDIVKHNLTCKSYSNNALIKFTEKEIAVGSQYKIFIVSVKDQKLINTIDLCIENCIVTALLKSSNKGIIVGCVKIDKNNENNNKYIIKQYDEKNNDICQLEQVHKGVVFCLCEIDEFSFVSCSIQENCAKLWKKKELNLI